MSQLQNQKKLLDAAQALFREKGYDNVAIPEICERAGCSPSTFYYQFKNKTNLLFQLIHRERVLTEAVLTRMLTEESPLERLWILHSAYVGLVVALGADLYGQVVKNQIAQSKGFLSIDDWEYTVSLATTFIAQAQERGEIRNSMPPRLLSEAVTRILNGDSYAWCTEKGSFDLYEMARRDIETLYDVRLDLRVATVVTKE